MKIEKEKRIYNGTYINGVKFENYLFMNGTEIIVADTFINAKNIISAVNKVARKLGLHTYNDLEELQSDIEDGYWTVEETNYYDEQTDKIYKYYISTIYTK